MRRLVEERVLGEVELVGERVEASGVGGGKGRHALDAVPILPAHVMRALAGRLDEIAQEILIGVGQVHSVGGAARLRPYGCFGFFGDAFAGDLMNFDCAGCFCRYR